MTMALGGWIAVVDDDAFIRQYVGDILRGQGYQIRIASSGMEGLALLHSRVPPALIIVDMLMPIVDGLEIVRIARKEADLGPIPILVISGVENRPDDVDGFLSKPFTPEQLLAMVRELLGRYGSQGGSGTEHGGEGGVNEAG
jgi:CheY-like chemotaxis protein